MQSTAYMPLSSDDIDWQFDYDGQDGHHDPAEPEEGAQEEDSQGI